MADSFGWSAYYQEPALAEEVLEPGPEDEDEAEGEARPLSADSGTQPVVTFIGPQQGVRVHLPDGVEVRLRYQFSDGAMQTQYRISARWMLPSPCTALVPGARRVIGYFKNRPHFTIPFDPAAREHLLGAQLEQSLLASASLAAVS